MKFRDCFLFIGNGAYITRMAWEGGGKLVKVPQATPGSIVVSPWLEIGFEGEGPFWPISEEDKLQDDWIMAYPVPVQTGEI